MEEVEQVLLGRSQLTASILRRLHENAVRNSGQDIGQNPLVDFGCPSCEARVFSLRYFVNEKALGAKCVACGHGMVIFTIADGEPVT